MIIYLDDNGEGRERRVYIDDFQTAFSAFRPIARPHVATKMRLRKVTHEDVRRSVNRDLNRDTPERHQLRLALRRF